MTESAQPTESQIRDFVGADVFKRGQSLYRRDRLVEAYAGPASLTGAFQPGAETLYTAEVTLDNTGIVTAACTCRAGRSGSCIHIAALLLTWLHRPEDFQRGDRLAGAVADLDRETLIELLIMAGRHHPDLEILLLLHIQTRPDHEGPPDATLIHRYIENLFFESLDSEMAGEEIAMGIDDLLELAEGLEEQERHYDAATIYQAIVEETAPIYSEMPDEDDDLLDILEEATAGLGRAAEGLEPGADRTTFRRALFDLYCWDAAEGGLGPSETAEATLIESATPDELRELADWVAALFAADPPWLDAFARLLLGGTWLEAADPTIDDEEFLSICRQTGRIDQLVMRLLALGRAEEAADELATAPIFFVTAIAELLVEAGRGRTAEEIVRLRLAETESPELLAWLQRRVEARGDIYEALELAEEIFMAWPSYPTYADLVRLAGETGTWDTVRARLLEKLIAEQDLALLVHLHLWEDEPTDAVEALMAADWDLDRVPIDLADSVARRLETKHPEAALAIYRQLVEVFIDAGERERYRDAADYLKQIRDLQDPSEWAEYITALRARYRRRPALLDELNRAGL